MGTIWARYSALTHPLTQSPHMSLRVMFNPVPRTVSRRRATPSSFIVVAAPQASTPLACPQRSDLLQHAAVPLRRSTISIRMRMATTSTTLLARVPRTNPKASGAKRRDEVRRQRIESEQRRRDELRDGYSKLREVLPSSNQKASKISLLDRATTHIRYLEFTQQQLQARLQQAEAENQRLRL